MPSFRQFKLQVKTATPLDFAFPALVEDDAVCIGLAIDWRISHALYQAALAFTVKDEHERAGRFLHMKDGLRYLLGRAMLRRTAANYADMDLHAPIPVNAWGKPVPACDFGFNISHSGNQVWVAVSPRKDVGIDVESTLALQDANDIIPNFHPLEISNLRNEFDTTAVMRCWSRKEAIAKAGGTGLSLPLNSYAVATDAQASGWMRIAPPGTRVTDWTVCDIPIGTDYVGALAILGHCGHITVLRLAA
ncbi:4'-phosphopantetheinyl transferase superfamily protein [Noviherbaspirillum sp. CPCC 100848]|uniref:4'-phosphopantetheinyl transferase superfamily protein n=1 Tax=Noviherbaspirillum album TaxID=3080276 RepID=A0ABU6JIH1_9BURK|nr:4'-phosphopantetheinyl transferase superfamily protein [Noviherbaspirillum sp. CPCC 100848]MEC4723476.1 4'-phosphopantetheinyl transferase superfamily protein [Noviherbaspirillum sp. CPCC 100848]